MGVDELRKLRLFRAFRRASPFYTSWAFMWDFAAIHAAATNDRSSRMNSALSRWFPLQRAPSLITNRVNGSGLQSQGMELRRHRI